MDLPFDGAITKFLEEGARSALICVDEPARLKTVKEALEDLNYYSSVASSVLLISSATSVDSSSSMTFTGASAVNLLTSPHFTLITPA